MSGVKATGATAKDKKVEVELWVGGEDQSTKTVLVQLEPEMALGFAHQMIVAATASKHQKIGQ